MLPEPDLFRNTSCSSHDPLCSGIAASNTDDVESLRSLTEVGGGVGCPSHLLSTLTLPRKKLRLVHSQGIPVYNKIFNTGSSRPTPREDRTTRRWYLVVIVLLYIGLLTSFSLNVSLLIRKEPVPPRELDTQLTHQSLTNSGPQRAEDFAGLNHGSEFAYTTACLVQDPCTAGSFYSCEEGRCIECPRDTYQAQWGQTSCWPCPNRTHTDGVGASSPAQCKLAECGKHSRPELAVLQTPNYPGGFPSLSSCHWRVRPAESQTSLIIIPSISLPPDCSYTLSIRSLVDKGSGVVLETCQSTDKPQILTAQSSAIYVDFSGKGNLTSHGFQVSILSVSSEVSQVLEAVLSPEWDRTKAVLGYNHKEERLVSRLLSLLSPGLRRQDKGRKRKDKPLIEVVQEDQSGQPPQDTNPAYLGTFHDQDIQGDQGLDTQRHLSGEFNLDLQ